MLERSIITFAQLGGEWVLWLLLVLSVFSIAAMLERTLFYARRRVDVGSLADQLGQLLDHGEIAKAKELLDGRDTMETNVVGAGLGRLDRGKIAVSETMQAEMRRQRTRFDAYLVFLGTLGNNAPFIGLLGTVLGVIRAFRDLSLSDPSAGGTSASVVMAGVSEALVATAVGLAVALPAVIAFNYFKTLVKRSVSNTETLRNALSTRLDALCSE